MWVHTFIGMELVVKVIKYYVSNTFPFPAELPVRFVKTLEEEVTVVKTQPLYLSCELNKDRDVVWTKNGKQISNEPGRFQINIIGLTQTLTILAADDPDAGVYTCSVESANIKCSSNVKVVGKFYFYVIFNITFFFLIIIMSGKTVKIENVCFFYFFF